MPDGSNLIIGQWNDGTSMTLLRRSGGGDRPTDAFGVVDDTGVAIIGSSESDTGIIGLSTGGVGVDGFSSVAFGVVGRSSGTNNAGVFGGASGDSPGVWGQTASASWPGVEGFATGTNNGIRGVSIGPAGGASNGVVGFSINGHGVVGIASSPGSFGGLFFGGLTVVGPKSAAVKHRDGSHRLFYSLESPESWFEDFGRARLLRGKSEVKLDPSFASFVSMDDYHVFLSPEGPSKGLYVSRRSRNGFSVREHERGASTLAFSYRIVARRKDLKIKRFKTVRLPVFDKNEFLKRPKSPEEPRRRKPMQFRGSKLVRDN